MKLPTIDADVFYVVGKYAFFTMALISCIKVVDMWSELKSYDVFSILANAVFYFVLAGFFAHLQKQQTTPTGTDDDMKEINKALEQLNLGNKHGQKRTR